MFLSKNIRFHPCVTSLWSASLRRVYVFEQEKKEIRSIGFPFGRRTLFRPIRG